jgi:hypothetical protein
VRLSFSAEKNRRLIPVLLGFFFDHQVHALAYQAIID